MSVCCPPSSSDAASVVLLECRFSGSAVQATVGTFAGRARTSSVALVCGVAGYAAYRAGLRLLGPRFVWRLVGSTLDGALAQDYELRSKVGGKPEDEEDDIYAEIYATAEKEDDANGRDEDKMSCASSSAISSPRCRLKNPRRQTSGGVLQRRPAGMVLASEQRRKMSASSGVQGLESLPEDPKTPRQEDTASTRSRGSASLRILWEGAQLDTMWDDEFVGQKNQCARAGAQEVRTNATDLASVFDDVLSVTTSAPQEDPAAVTPRPKADEESADIWRSVCAQDPSFMYQSVLIVDSEAADSEDVLSHVSASSGANLLALRCKLQRTDRPTGLWDVSTSAEGQTLEKPATSSSATTPGTATTTQTTTSSSGAMTSSFRSGRNNVMVDSALGTELLLSSDDEGGDEDEPRHRRNLDFIREDDDGAAASLSRISSLEWTDDLQHEREVATPISRGGASAKYTPTPPPPLPNGTRDLCAFARRRFSAASPVYKLLHFLSSRRNLRRVLPLDDPDSASIHGPDCWLAALLLGVRHSGRLRCRPRPHHFSSFAQLTQPLCAAFARCAPLASWRPTAAASSSASGCDRGDGTFDVQLAAVRRLHAWLAGEQHQEQCEDDGERGPIPDDVKTGAIAWLVVRAFEIYSAKLEGTETCGESENRLLADWLTDEASPRRVLELLTGDSHASMNEQIQSNLISLAASAFSARIELIDCRPNTKQPLRFLPPKSASDGRPEDDKSLVTLLITAPHVYHPLFETTTAV